MEIAKILLEESNSNVNFRNPRNETAVNIAALRNDTEMVIYFVEKHGANVSVEDSESITPLYAASLLGNLPLVKFLLERQDGGINNNTVYLTFLIAARNGQLEILRLVV
jgi:ankyrin repeat protein